MILEILYAYCKKIMHKNCDKKLRFKQFFRYFSQIYTTILYVCHIIKIYTLFPTKSVSLF